MCCLVFFSENKPSQMDEYIQPLKKNVRETVQFFKFKVCLTFDDLIFADISPFAVGSGSRRIENQLN